MVDQIASVMSATIIGMTARHPAAVCTILHDTPAEREHLEPILRDMLPGETFEQVRWHLREIPFGQPLVDVCVRVDVDRAAARAARPEQGILFA